jgi:hypothetical protein
MSGSARHEAGAARLAPVAGATSGSAPHEPGAALLAPVAGVTSGSQPRAACGASLAVGAGAVPPATRRPWPAPSSHGQATIELLGILPLALLIALTIAQLLAAGSARELAGNAAEAGAAALLQGIDPTEAARDALPDWSRDRATVHVNDDRVEVRLRPRTVIPLVANRLEARASADAGP